MTDESRPGPKRYRVRTYDDNYELLADKVHLNVFDLDTVEGLRAARVDLDSLRASLAVLCGITQAQMPTFRLSVHTWPEGDYVMDWIDR